MLTQIADLPIDGRRQCQSLRAGWHGIPRGLSDGWQVVDHDQPNR